MLLSAGKQKNSKPLVKYPHTNGKLDGLITEIYVAREWIKPLDEKNDQHVLTEKGLHHLLELGLQATKIDNE